MTYAEAIPRLAVVGLAATERAFGVEIEHADARGRLRIQIGRSSAGGDECSIQYAGELVRWFRRPTLAELVALVIAAQTAVQANGAASLIEALDRLDG